MDTQDIPFRSEFAEFFGSHFDWTDSTDLKEYQSILIEILLQKFDSWDIFWQSLHPEILFKDFEGQPDLQRQLIDEYREKDDVVKVEERDRLVQKTLDVEKAFRRVRVAGQLHRGNYEEALSMVRAWTKEESN